MEHKWSRLALSRRAIRRRQTKAIDRADSRAQPTNGAKMRMPPSLISDSEVTFFPPNLFDGDKVAC